MLTKRKMLYLNQYKIKSLKTLLEKMRVTELWLKKFSSPGRCINSKPVRINKVKI